MTTQKVKQVLSKLRLPKHCVCGHPYCDKCHEWMMTHEERVALERAIKFYMTGA